MTRLYIVEQSGLQTGGHYQAYTSCVVAGARQLGLHPVVLVNKRLKTQPGGLSPEMVPAFTYTWAEAELEGKLAWEEGNLAYEMFEAFRHVRPNDEDHVFLHTTGYRELLALLDCLTGKLPGEPLPYFHLLLRRDPDILIENYRDYAEYFARIAASSYLRRKILLHTDTHLLSQAFAEVCRVPFATAPIPFDQTPLLEALAARRPRRAGDPLTIVYLGDAREEKGYQHLPQALSYLWKDYVEPGRVRFVLQSNFNTPGGEPGILSASQNLAGFPSTTLKTEPLEPPEYYRILADADIVLIPYSAQRYRYRSSGVLVEAMGAGKVVVTSAGSWMATQVGADHAVLFDTPAELGPAIATAIDRFAALSKGAAKHRDPTLANATGASLVQHLVTAAAAASAGMRRIGRRVLFVMNGDAMALENGASRIAHAQLQYLAAAGFDIVGLFLSYSAPADAEAFRNWRLALARSIAPFPFERVFVAGAGQWSFEEDRSPEVRNRRQSTGASLRAEFEFVENFEYGAPLLQFLRTHRVDAVLLNYVTNFPVVETLGLDGVPVICEMHDVQSFQRAIYGQRLVDEDDLEEEFKWLARCAALVSLNPRETAIVRERLPGAVIETSGVFLPTPPSPLQSLAGAKDLAEIVSSSGPLLREYQFEAAWEIGNVGAVQRLIEAGAADLLFVSSAHMANVSGLKWFLSEVYEPYLAERQVSMIVAGSISRIGGWPEYPRLFFVDQVEDLTPLYAASQVVVLPITEGAGGPVKTFEALAYGRPVVGTSHAFRGVDGAPGEFIQHDDPEDFAAAILALLESEEARREAAERSRQTAARLNDYGRYFATMDRVFAHVLPGAVEATPPPPVTRAEASFVEWPAALQPVNRLVRSYVDGEPLEGWALDMLSTESDEEVERLLDGVSRSLLIDRDAAVLRTEQRLKRYLASPLGARLREHAVFAVKLALAGRRGTPPPALTGAAAGLPVVAYGGLPLTMAVLADEGERDGVALRVDGKPVATRLLADARRRFGRARVLQAEAAALDGGTPSLRTAVIDGITRDGVPRAGVLRQSIRIMSGGRLLERDVLAGEFEARGDGTGADLAPGESGRLAFPRIVDGVHPGYVDVCFAHSETDAAGTETAQRAAPAIALALDDRPVEFELIARGGLLVARVLLGVHSDVGDFGVGMVSVTNRSRRAGLRLVALHSGLLLGNPGQAADIATALTMAGQRHEPANHARLAAMARMAVATIMAGELPEPAAMDALSVIAEAGSGQDALRALVSQEVARSAGRDGVAPGAAAAADGLTDDVLAILAALLGSGDAASAIVSPLLPLAIVDEAGNPLAADTAAAQQRRGASWRIPLPPEGSGRRIAVRVDAGLEVAGHPGAIAASGFHPLESPGATHRWTGPEPTATIAVPIVLNRPARVVFELGPTGQNTASADFSVACNGRVVPHLFESGDNGATVTADVPAVRAAGGAVEFSLTVANCFQQPPDRRVLGVVFRSLSVLFGGSPEAPSQSQAAPLAVPTRPGAARRRTQRTEAAPQADPGAAVGGTARRGARAGTGGSLAGLTGADDE